MDIWQSLESKEVIPHSNLLQCYYSSDKTVPFASNHELQELHIWENSWRLGFDRNLKQSLLQEARSSGQSTFMSADNFCSFEEMISNSTTLQSGGSVKSLVDIFVYRALAMIDPPEYAAFDAEYRLVGLGVPSDKSRSGIDYIPSSVIDYQIVVSKDSADADKFLSEGVNYQTMVQRGQSILHMSVLEPEPQGVDLRRCIPHTVAKIHAAAKALQKAVMRGALTDGSKWIFLILNLNPDGVGASYSYTSPLLDIENYRRWSDEEGKDIMTGILASWIQRSFEPHSDKDWLKFPY